MKLSITRATEVLVDVESIFSFWEHTNHIFSFLFFLPSFSFILTILIFFIQTQNLKKNKIHWQYLNFLVKIRTNFKF